MGLPAPTAFELFSGAGGMTLGFEQTGVELLGAFDSEPFNVETHKLNFSAEVTFEADLAMESGESLRELCKTRSEIDLVFGGPPCQGFSVGGRQDIDDERNQLVFAFARLVRQLRPKYFVMENVKGLMSMRARPILRSFVLRMKRAGYEIVEPIQILNAADYGVPQRRLRVFILGALKGLPLPSYPEPITTVASKNRPFVKHAIDDLPDLENREELFDTDVFRGALKQPDSSYAQVMRGLLRETGDLAEPRTTSLDSLTGCLRTKHSQETIRRFESTAPGSVEPISRYFRLSREEVSPTLRSGTGSDHGSHTAPRPIHHRVPRCITTREAARLHSFPDWFQFHGTRWHDFRQIGNAVPPRLARAVAAEVVKTIGQCSLPSRPRRDLGT